MKIYIPTYRRVHSQKTYSFIPPRWRKKTVIVCVADEADALRRACSEAHVLVQPSHINTISAKRQWIMETCDTEKILMLDDDLRFCVRDPRFGATAWTKNTPRPVGVALPIAKPDSVGMLFDEIELRLDDYAHVGISMRMGNQTHEPTWKDNKRMCCALAYRVEKFHRFARFDAIHHREDMYVTLRLLQAGYANSVTYKWAIDQHYNKSGGEAAAGRNMKHSDADAVKLAEMFPELVKVVDREYKQSLHRKEVVVQWVKAFSEHLS